MSRVFVAHMLCTAIGAPPPTATGPIATERVAFLASGLLTRVSANSAKLSKGRGWLKVPGRDCQ